MLTKPIEYNIPITPDTAVKMALNLSTKTIYYVDDNGIIQIVGSVASNNGVFNNVTITGGTIQGVALTLDSLDNTPIGSNTPSTGRFTTLTTTGLASFNSMSTANVTITGGTIQGVALTLDSLDNTPIGSNTPSTGRFTTLSASSTVSGAGFSTYLASPPAIGGTAAAAGSFTALSYTTTFTGGTGIVNLGSGQFYKDASGNVGIGTSSPSTYVGASGGLVVAQDVTLVNNTTQPANNYPRFFQLSGVGPSISGLQFTVNTGGSSTTAPTERMRITSGGLVGISTSSPRSNLDVNGQLIVGAIGATNNPYMVISGNEAANTVGFNSSASVSYPSFTWTTAAVERMRIDAFGNVGIGTSSPASSAILDVQSTTKGVRMPNMTTTQKNAISSPVAGLMVFDTTLAKLCVYSGSAWQTITST